MMRFAGIILSLLPEILDDLIYPYLVRVFCLIAESVIKL